MENKKLTKNQIFLIGFIVLVGIFILFSGLGHGYNSNPFSYIKKITSSTSNDENIIYNSISLGSDPVIQKNINFSFTWSEIGQSIDYYTWGKNETTTGNYVAVYLNIINNDLNSKIIAVNNFTLIDEAGRVYYPVTTISCDENKDTFSSNLLELKPDIPCNSKLLFEVSKNSNSVNLNFEWK